jgi:hypothetical protein
MARRRKFERGEVTANAPPVTAGANHAELFGPPPDETLDREEAPSKVAAPDSYTTQEVCDAAGISGPLLSQWVTAGYVRPSHKVAEQQGERALWSPADRDQVMALRQLVDRAKVMTGVETVASAWKRTLTTARDRVVVVTATSVRIVESDTLLSVLCRELREPCLVIGLGRG